MSQPGCPVCDDSVLREVLTRPGVAVDRCDSCGGVWLDRGEIYDFVEGVDRIHQKLGDQNTGRFCPRCHSELWELELLKEGLFVEQCADCRGLWFDPGKFERAFGTSVDAIVAENHPEPTRKTGGSGAQLPNLNLYTGGSFLLLYGILGAVIIALIEFTGMTPFVGLIIGVVVVVLQFVFSPWLMDLSLTWFYDASFLEDRDHAREALAPHLYDFIDTTCADHDMDFPDIGIIMDGNPNAFTYGHTPDNARIVITSGLMELLDERELESVVAHEIGHAVHWDMALMTAAQLVPLVLYYIYRTAGEVASGSDSKASNYARIAAIGGYVLYIVSEYVVLALSRVREYYADRFAGRVMGNPNHLSRALIKIGYGLARTGSDDEDGSDSSGEQNKKSGKNALGALGIFDSDAAMSMAVSSAGGGVARPGGTDGEVEDGKSIERSLDKDNIKRAMRWDLWNPWAKFYELHSTHPLVAYRLQALGEQASAQGQKPFISFDLTQPESYWDEFAVDVFVQLLPWLALLGVLGTAGYQFATGGVTYRLLSLLVGGLGLAYFVKTWFEYMRGDFQPMSIAGCLKHVEVSAVRGIPVELEGEIIGRGVAGLIWSEDFVLQDETGIMLLDYSQPIRIWEFLFGLLRNKSFQRREVTLRGWYRRAPVPYVELWELETSDQTARSYVFPVKLAVSFSLLAASIAGLILL